MQKNWVTFFSIVGVAILIITAFQFVFLFLPVKQVNLYNPPKMSSVFETEILESVHSFYKNHPIDDKTLEPYQFREFVAPAKE